VTLDNLHVLNAIVYVAEQGCKWRGLPKRFGNWHTIYTRMNRWSKSGVLDRIFAQLQHTQILRVKIEAVALDSTIVKVHPDGTGALKKTARKPLAGPAADGPPRFIWLPRMLERPSRLPCPRARPTMRPRDASCWTASVVCCAQPTC
jgi:transposase